MLTGFSSGAPGAPENTSHRAAHILSTAATLFYEKGFDSVSLRQLARGAGISSGSLYHYIESKQSLLYELMDDALTLVLDESNRAIKALSKGEDGLATFVSVFIATATDERASLALALRSAPQLSANQQAALAVQLQDYLKLLKTLVEQRLRFHGYKCPCDEQLANSILCLLKSYMDDDFWLTSSAASELYFELVDTWIKGVCYLRVGSKSALALP